MDDSNTDLYFYLGMIAAISGFLFGTIIYFKHPFSLPLNLNSIISWPTAGGGALIVWVGLQVSIKQILRRANQSMKCIFISMLGMATLLGFGWAALSLSAIFHWQLPESTWRIPAEIEIRVTEITQHFEYATRIEGCILTAPPEWALPVYKKCPAKARFYVYSPWQENVNQYSNKNKVSTNSVTATDINPLPGERWRLTVRARPVSGLKNEGGFNYQKYAVRHQLKLTGSIQASKLLETAPAYHWQTPRIYIFKKFKQYALSSSGTSQNAIGILLALSLGERAWVEQAIWLSLQKSGLAHLMAISGLHLGLVFYGALYLARFTWALFAWSIKKASVILKVTHLNVCNRHLAGQKHLALNSWVIQALFALAVTLFYGVLSGGSIATLRATIFIVLWIFNRIFQTQLNVFKRLLLTVAIVFLLDPLSPLDAGFWLSAGAVFAISIWHWRQGQKKKNNLWHFEWMLFLALAPLSLLYFGGIPLLAPIANLLVVPIFSFLILPLLLLSLGLLFISERTTLFIWDILTVLIQMVIEAIERLTHLSWVWFESAHIWPALFFLTFLTVWVAPTHFRVRWYLGLVVFLWVFPILRPQEEAEFAVHFLDVGQGSAIIIQRGAKALIYDTGPSYRGDADLSQQVILPFLRYHRLQPELLVLSHPHQDHVGGVRTLLKKYPKLSVIESQITQGYQNSEQKYPLYFQNRLKAACKMGQQWVWESVQIKVLAPLPGPSLGANNDSCVIMLDYLNKRVLLPGDSEWENEYRLVGRFGSALKADVLAVPHHGSKKSSQNRFIKAVQPQFAVINRGFANQFSMPAKEVLERYAASEVKVYDTALQGQITLYLDKSQQWQVRYQRRLNQLF